MRCCAVALAAAAMLPVSADGQDANLNVFLFEKSYAAVGNSTVAGGPSYYFSQGAEPDLLAEAQFVVHVPLLRQVGFQSFQDGEGRGFNLFLTPQMRLRALKITSGPIRSMSFMPKFALQHVWVRGGSGDGSAGTRHVFGLTAISGHHSNGGATCEFIDQVQRPSDGDCEIPGGGPPPPAETRAILVNGGNFSTNYVEFGAGYRVGTTVSSGTDHWVRFLEISASWQHHHTWFPLPLPGGPDPAFGELYGLDRFRLDLNIHILASRLAALRWNTRVDAWLPDADRFPGASNHTVQSELFVQFVDDIGESKLLLPGIMGVGLRFSKGMDYYNTQFVRDISALQIALYIDPWSPRITS